MTACYFIRPLDVLSVRGNRSFGGSGEFGEAVMPPWPSLFAGALRSAMLGRDAQALAAFGPGRPRPAGLLGEVLGTPEAPGSFRLEWASLARRIGDACEPIMPLPADLAALRLNGAVEIHSLRPRKLPAGVRAASPLPLIPVLRVARQEKPKTGIWLAGKALAAYLAGEGGLAAHILRTDQLFECETRVGIGLNSDAATAEKGLLYSTDAVTFLEDYGFLAAVSAAADPAQLLPDGSLLRLGGDGRAAVCESLPDFAFPQAPLQQVERDRRFRLVLISPAIFQGGWLPDRVEGTTLRGEGFSADLVCAAVPRAAVISGWDLANWKPKAALRAAPAGSVYWFNNFQGGPRKLAQWVAGGLWGDNPDVLRRTEGFNRALLAAWPAED